MNGHPGNEPSQAAVFAASEPFQAAKTFPDVRGPFIGVDGFSAEGPTPIFGTPKPLGAVEAGCLDIHRSLGFYLDGALTPAQDHAVRTHLVACPSCEGAQAFHMQLRTTVSQRSVDLAPQALRSKIAAALEASTPSDFDLDE